MIFLASKGEDITEVGKAGVRLDETVPGDRFGLSIANEVSKLYGGRHLKTRSGGGLSATVLHKAPG